MGNVWAVYGKCMGNVWTMYGQCMDNVWTMYGQCMGNVWTMYGQCMGNVWVFASLLDLTLVYHAGNEFLQIEIGVGTFKIHER